MCAGGEAVEPGPERHNLYGRKPESQGKAYGMLMEFGG